MTAQDVLVRVLERNTDSFVRMVRRVPQDRLTWSPGDGVRSALDQFQEVATLVGDHWSVFSDRRMEMTPESFRDWITRRSALTDLDALETRLRADTQRLIEFVRELPEADLSLPVQLPFPGEYRMVDVIQNHAWNLAYHEGQIAGLLQQLGVEPMG